MKAVRLLAVCMATAILLSACPSNDRQMPAEPAGSAVTVPIANNPPVTEQEVRDMLRAELYEMVDTSEEEGIALVYYMEQTVDRLVYIGKYNEDGTMYSCDFCEYEDSDPVVCYDFRYNEHTDEWYPSTAVFNDLAFNEIVDRVMKELTTQD